MGEGEGELGQRGLWRETVLQKPKIIRNKCSIFDTVGGNSLATKKLSVLCLMCDYRIFPSMLQPCYKTVATH